jgi:hypothetical protein
MFPGYSGIKLEINNRNISDKFSTYLEIFQIFKIIHGIKNKKSPGKTENILN